MRLLDLFCGAGGCSVGYARAGFEVVGVDIEPHPDYPFTFVQGDALEYLSLRGDEFDVRHASPPCPRYSSITPEATRDDHPDLLGPTRLMLQMFAGPYVIENVPGARAELVEPALYCGAAFGLGADCRDGRFRPLRRHRLFESNVFLMTPGCGCDGRQAVGVYGTGGGGFYQRPSGGGGYKAHPEEARAALGIEWMTRRDDLSDAIPPAYTEHIGHQLAAHLEVAA